MGAVPKLTEKDKSNNTHKMQSRRLSQLVALPQVSSKSEKKKRNVCSKILRRLWSFETMITLLILFAVGTTAASIWPSNFVFARRGVKSVAHLARTNTILRMTDNIQDFLDGQAQFLHVMKESLRVTEQLGQPIVDLSDRELLMILSIGFNVPTFNGVNMGFEDGRLFGLIRSENRVRAYKSTGNGTLIYYMYNTETEELGEEESIVQNYYNDNRPWYVSAVEANRTTWSLPFESFVFPPKVIITLGTPFYSKITNNLTGVLSLEIDLNYLSDYLETLTTFNHTRIMLLGQDGSLIAASRGNSYSVINSTHAIRNPGDKSSDPIIRETINVLSRTGRLDADNNTITDFEFNDDDSKRIAAIRGINDQYGIEWTGVIVFEEDDILTNVLQANRVNAIVCSVSFLLSAIIAIIACLILFWPLSRVWKEIDKVADLNFKKSKKIRTFNLFELKEISTSLARMKQGLRNFEKYVPAVIVKEIVSSEKQNALGVVSRNMTVLFTDIENFTTIAEEISPEILLQIMSTFFKEMANIIAENEGAVDKYIGDAIMALFNAPHFVPEHQFHAVLSAYQMNQKIAALNVIWQAEKLPLIRIRVGINSGNCLVGNIGSENRMNYTALGDNVNIASRCESLNKYFGTRIMITESTYIALKKRFECCWLGYVAMKGKSMPIHVYSVLSTTVHSTLEQRQLASLHNDLKESIERGDNSKARNLCHQLIEREEQNVTARLILQKLEECSATISMDSINLVLNEK